MTDLNARVGDFVRRVVTAMGLPLEVTLEETPDHVRLNLVGDGAEEMLRKRGEPLDALQHLVNTAFRKDLRGDRHFTVDCLDYRKAKDAEVRQMALFAIAKVKASGLAQEIGPLNPYARRLVHLTVAEDPAVASESIGDAFMKTVIISLGR
ncbi:MAG: hypothetical protein LC804_26410 [Acidobacteria bacterium]|nr:hypothetical protein [Acidobacteriota bacterium]